MSTCLQNFFFTLTSRCQLWSLSGQYDIVLIAKIEFLPWYATDTASRVQCTFLWARQSPWPALSAVASKNCQKKKVRLSKKQILNGQIIFTATCLFTQRRQTWKQGLHRPIFRPAMLHISLNCLKELHQNDWFYVVNIQLMKFLSHFIHICR